MKENFESKSLLVSERKHTRNNVEDELIERLAKLKINQKLELDRLTCRQRDAGNVLMVRLAYARSTK